MAGCDKKPVKSTVDVVDEGLGGRKKARTLCPSLQLQQPRPFLSTSRLLCSSTCVDLLVREVELGKAAAAGVREVVSRGRRGQVLAQRERLELDEEGDERRHLGRIAREPKRSRCGSCLPCRRSSGESWREDSLAVRCCAAPEV